MYVIGSLASNRQTQVRSADPLRAAIPGLLDIAENDHRLAPGYWWSMSAEAEDVIHCIENGTWPEIDAAERWQGNKERGARELV